MKDERFRLLSDVLPTAWQSVVYADVARGGALLVLGLGPIGDMACRIGLLLGLRVIGVDRVPERPGRARGAAPRSASDSSTRCPGGSSLS